MFRLFGTLLPFLLFFSFLLRAGFLAPLSPIGVKWNCFVHGCYIRPGPDLLDFGLRSKHLSDYPFVLFLRFVSGFVVTPLYDYDGIGLRKEGLDPYIFFSYHHMLL